MKLRIFTLIAVMTFFAALALPVRMAAQEQQEQRKKEQPRYRVKDLGTLGGTFSLAGGINNRGEVEGISTLPGDTAEHAFLWRKGLMTDLGTLGGPNSGAAWRPSGTPESFFFVVASAQPGLVLAAVWSGALEAAATAFKTTIWR